MVKKTSSRELVSCGKRKVSGGCGWSEDLEDVEDVIGVELWRNSNMRKMQNDESRSVWGGVRKLRDFHSFGLEGRCIR